MSPPTKNLINELLPIELFDEIFALLTPPEQLAAMTTCAHWYQILDLNRNRRRLRLNPISLTGDLAEGDIRWMKRFRSIVISDCGPFGDFSNLIAGFVDQEVRKTVEEVELSLEWIDWEDFFVDSSWAKLRSLSIEAPRMEIPDVGEVRLIAPNLRKIEVADVSESIGDLVQRFSDQLEEYRTVIRSMKDFDLIFGETQFKKLRRLTLDTNMWKESELWNDRDLTASNLQMFSGLKHLKVTDWEEKFYPVLPKILSQTALLESLTIEGCGLSCSAMREISKMKNLIELNLFCRVEDTKPLSLLNLQKLTTCYKAAFPLGSVPSLKWLVIKNNPLVKVPEVLRAKLVFPETYFKTFSENLEVLHLEHLNLKDRMKQICTLSNLKVIKLLEVLATDLEITQLFSTFDKLKTLRLEHCLLIKDRDSTMSEDFKNWPRLLKQRHSKIAVTFVNCRFL